MHLEGQAQVLDAYIPHCSHGGCWLLLLWPICGRQDSNAEASGSLANTFNDGTTCSKHHVCRLAAAPCLEPN